MNPGNGSSPPPLGEPAYIILPVVDLAAEVEFLRQVVGLEMTEMNQKWASFRLGSLTLSLKQVASNTETGQIQSRTNSLELSIPVADFASSMNHLLRHGIAMLEAPRIICSEHGKSYQHVRFLSPNGHCFSIYQIIGQNGV